MRRSNWPSVVLFLFFVSAAAAEYRDDTGWFDLLARLGAGMPTGENIVVLHVEGNAPGYLPFIGAGVDEFDGKTNIDLTGGAMISGHAAKVGRRWYGNQSGFAPGIVTIQSYEASDYLNTVLDWTTQYAQPDWDDFIADLDPGEARIINNSWIVGTGGTFAYRSLARSDFQTEHYGLIYVNAVNNGAGTGIPVGLTSSFNGLAVGLSNGGSSAGPTTVEGSRAKPDLVAPDNFTSFGTPMVAGGVAMLLQQGTDMGSTEAQLPQVVKAILLAGAEKLAGWEKGDPGAADDAVHPLDWRQGAGELQVDRNYDIMAGGNFAANSGNLVKRRGWSYDMIGFNQTNDYLVHIATGDTTLSVALTWHRHHTGNFFVDGVHPLNNIALELWETDGANATVMLQESRSLVDNVQHVYTQGLDRGVYLVRLSGLSDNNPGPEDYGLAWWSDGIVVKGDMNGDGAVDSEDIDPFFIALGNPATFEMIYPGVDLIAAGDVNGDNAVDAEDIDPFFVCIGNGGCP